MNVFCEKYSFIWGLAALMLIWVLVADVGETVSGLLLPPLHSVLERLWQMATEGGLWQDTAATLWRWVQGFVLGAFFGTLAGLILGVFPRAYKTLEGVIEFFRAMPVTAIFPLFLLVFGIGDASKVAMAFLPTFLLMLINSSYGVLHAGPERRRAVQVFGATRWQTFRYVVIFEALPQIFIGLRLALSLSLVVAVVSEMFIGTDFGLGQRIYDSYLTNAVTTLYALLLVLGGIGYALNKASMAVERHVVDWAGRV